LENILFRVAPKPWDDAKYEKRLNRLFYLYFINIFIQLEHGTNRIIVLHRVKTLIERLQKATTSEAVDIPAATNALNLFAAKNAKWNLNINSLVTNIRQLLPKITSKDDVVHFTKMLDTLLVNANFVIGSIYKIRKYCAVQGEVRQTALGRAQVKDIV
jgi:hypothetical protein